MAGLTPSGKMPVEETEERLLSFFRERILPADMVEGFDESTPVLELGVLDSLKTAVTLNFIRDELGVKVPASKIDPANFTDVRALAAMVAALTGSVE